MIQKLEEMSMVCKNCNTEVQNGEKFCPTCGAFLEQQEQQQYNPTGAEVPPQYQPDYADPQESEFVFGMLKQECSSKLFLALCILASVGPVMTLLSMGLSGIISAAIPAILAISCWVMYVSATQNKDITGFINPLKTINVVATVEWVINWVAVGLVGLVAVIFFIGAGALDGMMDMVMDGFEDAFGGMITTDMFEGMFAVLGIIMLLVAGLIAVINIFYYGNLRKCTASFKDSAIYGRFMVAKVGTVKTWLMVMGVISAISAISSFAGSFFGGLGSAAGAAALIVASKILENIKKATNCD